MCLYPSPRRAQIKSGKSKDPNGLLAPVRLGSAGLSINPMMDGCHSGLCGQTEVPFVPKVQADGKPPGTAAAKAKKWGYYPLTWHLVAPGNPCVLTAGAMGLAAGFLAVGMPAWSRFRNQELSCLPPAPFIAQTATWFMAAQGHCTGSIKPISQCFLPGNLAPVQSIQEGLAALCSEGAREDSGFPGWQECWILG